MKGRGIQQRSLVSWGLGLGLAGLVILGIWLWLQANADTVVPGETAAPIPRAGIVSAIEGSTITLKGADSEFTILVDDATVIRHAADGAFTASSRDAITVGQLAMITAELTGATVPVGAIDLVDIEREGE